MVTLFLRGGLGNQMFQYATGLALAKRNNSEVLIDTVHLDDRFPRGRFTRRTYDLADVFLTQPKFTFFSRMARKMPIPGFWLGLDVVEIALRTQLRQTKLLRENENLGINENIVNAHGNIVLFGRLENEKYFKDFESDIRSAFEFRNELTGEAKEVATHIAASNSVSIHIRRGDQLKIWGETNTDYYDQAISHISSKVSDPKFFIFSDDIEWCKANMKFPASSTYLTPDSAGPKNGFHLELMSRCKHNIIAPSTFSWWGAWLNKNPSKIVIAPKRWPQLQPEREKEILPVGWIGL